MKLSVVIANRDRTEPLDVSLRFWRNQRQFDQNDLELIVADDGSKNPPEYLIDKYKIKLVHAPAREERRGPCVAWNEGLRAATGDVLACTHPEIAPGLDVARYLYGSCVGDEKSLEGLIVWAPGDGSTWDNKVVEIPVVTEDDIKRLGTHAVRANVSVFRLRENLETTTLAGMEDPSDLLQNETFWDYKTEFGEHTNREILKRFRGFFWNNLFSMKRDVWEWSNYFRPSDDWGVDDSDTQVRNTFLKIGYVFTDSTFGYHQWHFSNCRAGILDHAAYHNLADARLLGMYPETSDRRLNLTRGAFWYDHIAASEA